MQLPQTVYVMQSESVQQQYYIGITSDIAKRLAAHNAGESRHTRKFRPWRLITAIGFGNPNRALDFEKYLKSHSGRAFVKRHFR